jgi:hypothetical protein
MEVNRQTVHPVSKTKVLYMVVLHFHMIMLFRRLAALSALSAPISLACLSVSTASTFAVRSAVMLPAGSSAFFSLTLFSLATLVLFPKLVALALLTFPLPVRLCSDGSVPSDFSGLRSSGRMEAGTDEWRRAFRAAFASSVMRVRGFVVVSAGEESVKSKIARLSLSGSSDLTMGSLGVGFVRVVASKGTDTDFDVLVVGIAAFLLAVLVSLMSAEMALDAVETLTSTASDAGELLLS